MSSKQLLSLVFLCWSMGTTLEAQLDTNRFPLIVLPTPGTNLISESTNLLSLTIANWAVTNLVTEVDGEGNETITTNIVPLLTNLSVIATYPAGTGTNTNVITLILQDTGQPPDKLASDGTFSTNLFTPFTQLGTTMELSFTLKGTDISSTNEAGEVLEEVPFTNRFIVQYFISPRPPNDKMTNAFKIASLGGVSSMTNTYASLEAKEAKHAKVSAVDASIWWFWSSPVTTNVLIDTAGSAFGPVLAVYTGTALSNLVEVASATDDTVNKLKAHVNFDAVAGVTYRIAVAGKDATTNNMGWIRLRVAPGAEADTHPPTVSIDTPARSTVVANEVLSLFGSAKEPISTDSGISNVLVRVNEGLPITASGADSWSLDLILPAGTNIIRAYAIDYAGNVGPADAIVVRYINPTNDLFSSAGRLTGVGGVAETTSLRATREPDEPMHAGNGGGHSVWYYWRAPSAGELRLSTLGSTFDTLLGLYVGTQLTNLIAVASNDDAYSDSEYSELTYGVISNQLYYIAVDGYGSEAGDLMLQYAFVPPTPGQFYNLTLLGSPGGKVSPPSGTYRSGARVVLTATPETSFEFSGWEGDLQSLNNPLTIVMDQDLSLSARFRLMAATNAPVTDGFESGNLKRLNWETQGSGKWSVQTNITSRGTYAARSGAIGDGQFASLVLQTNLLGGAASFNVRVSSEAGWDYLEFYVGTNLVQRWSGEVAWTNYVFNASPGLIHLEWRYVKDGNFSGGLDAAFIDNLYVPLDTTVPEGRAFSLLISFQRDDQVFITLKGEPGRSYSLEASPDLFNWIPIDTRSSESGIIQFIDPEAAGYRDRFYRALSP